MVSSGRCRSCRALDSSISLATGRTLIGPRRNRLRFQDQEVLVLGEGDEQILEGHRLPVDRDLDAQVEPVGGVGTLTPPPERSAENWSCGTRVPPSSLTRTPAAPAAAAPARRMSTPPCRPAVRAQQAAAAAIPCCGLPAAGCPCTAAVSPACAVPRRVTDASRSCSSIEYVGALGAVIVHIQSSAPGARSEVHHGANDRFDIVRQPNVNRWT